MTYNARWLYMLYFFGGKGNEDIYGIDVGFDYLGFDIWMSTENE
jgi:hypothetical protein